MTIANRASVRALAGNRSATTVPDADIDVAILASDAIVKTTTQVYDWADTDPDWGGIKLASELLASAQIRSRFQDETDEAEEQRDWAMQILESVNKHVAKAGAGGGEPLISKPYSTYPMSADVVPDVAVAWPSDAW
jgi:hypothetical protein